MWRWARGLPKIFGFLYNICATTEASNFNNVTRLGFTKAHHKIPHRIKSGHGPGLEELPKILGFPFNICAMAEARNFIFGMQLGFAKVHHKATPRGKSGCGLWLGKLRNIWGSPLLSVPRLCCPLSVSGASCYFSYACTFYFLCNCFSQCS